MATKKKNDSVKDLKEKLFNTQKNAWNGITKAENSEIFKLNDDYKTFLDECKTEREAVSFIGKVALKQGYKPIEKAGKTTKKLYIKFDNVASALIQINHTDFEKGFIMVELKNING